MINSRLVLSVWDHFLLTCFLAFILVFDDGDERTLRRTSLCLKGERHFAESEVRWTSTESWVVECYFFLYKKQQINFVSSLFTQTLDQLPLTNPEHFGTPVIGKKSNRGRRSSLPV